MATLTDGCRPFSDEPAVVDTQSDALVYGGGPQ